MAAHEGFELKAETLIKAWFGYHRYLAKSKCINTENMNMRVFKMSEYWLLSITWGELKFEERLYTGDMKANLKGLLRMRKKQLIHRWLY